jgi:CBS domain-containing protein
MEEVRITPENFWFHLYNINLFLALFNLIPAFPMDGGRIFRALLSFQFSRIRATRIAVNLGQIIAIGFVVLGFYINAMLNFIGLFILLGAQAELSFEEVKATLKEIKVGNVLMQKYSTLGADEPLSHAVSLLLDGQEKSFVVKDNDEIKGTLSWKDVVAALSENQSDALIGQVMNKEPVRLKVDESLENVMLKVQEKPHDLYLVYSGNEFAGVLNMENISEFLVLQNALKQ